MTAGLGDRILSALRRWGQGGAFGDAAAARRWQFLRVELAGNATGRRIASHRAGPPRHRRPSWWNTPTQAYPQVGRAGWLTPAQTWRANGSRWAVDVPLPVRGS